MTEGILSIGALSIGMAFLTKLEPLYDFALIGAGMLCIGQYGWDKIKTIRGNKYNKLFEGIGLKNKKNHYPYFKGKEETSKGYKLYFTLPVGMSSFDFTKHKFAIQQYLNANRIDITYANHNVIMDVVDKTLEKCYEYDFDKAMKGLVPCIIGMSHMKLETIDLADGEPHLLIAGESGSGKSTILRGIITSLLQHNKTNLHLIDLKNGAEFGMFMKCKQVKSFARNANQAAATLSNIESVIDQRYNLFFENQVVDIKEYNKQFKPMLSYEVVIVDEFADLKSDDETMERLERISAKARACGVHLIISTQRPDAQILNGRIKANIPRIVGLKCMNGTNSRIIIDKQGLENLRGKGHGVLRSGGKEIEIQAMLITPQQARNIAKEFYEEKKKCNNIEQTVIDFDFLEGIKNAQ